jgi:hypothetical protein
VPAAPAGMTNVDDIKAAVTAGTIAEEKDHAPIDVPEQT